MTHISNPSTLKGKYNYSKTTTYPNEIPTHSCGDFFWAKQEENETPQEHWRKLVSLEKSCEFKDIKQEDLLILKFITRTADITLQETIILEKSLNLKATMNIVTQDSYERRHKQVTTPTALVKDKKYTEKNQYRKLKRDKKQQPRWNSSNEKWLRTTPLDTATKTSESNYCHKLEHFAKVFRSKTKKEKRKRINSKQPLTQEKKKVTRSYRLNNTNQNNMTKHERSLQGQMEDQR